VCRVLAGSIGARAAGAAFATLAEVLVEGLLAAVREEFERAHGTIRGGEVAILAMGKLGSREMTATSDLDLILLYDFDERGAALGRRAPAARRYLFHAPDPAPANTSGALRADRGRGRSTRSICGCGRRGSPGRSRRRSRRHP
jgi:ABC-type tungstate transport system permease subunit